MASLVPHPTVKKATLHSEVPDWSKPYVFPFLFLYPYFFYIYFTHYDTYLGAREWTVVALGTIMCIQALLWLSTHWSIEVKAWFTTMRQSSVDTATLIKIIPAPNNGIPEFCKLSRDIADGDVEISFIFQSRRFVYNPDTKSFAPPVYPIDCAPKIGDLLTAKGLDDTELAVRLYGKNTFDVPVPTFSELFREHAVAPFFVFQIFCVGLWCLDEQWKFSLFTLFMLVAFESTVVWQRQRTTMEFRSMNIQPFDVYVYRKGAWTQIRSDDILPNDIISVTRTKDDSAVPCDMIILHGSAIVNEAMLSGESTPLLKESIALRPTDASIDIEGLDKNSVLYSGTKVLQVTEPKDDDNCVVPNPPDSGAIAIVTKTGFETSQGSLIRTMIFSTERVSANNTEALLFILFLLIFAIAASWYVWNEGVRNDRKRSKLLLYCVIIITSVVPPELPMELTLAVNSSLAALSKFAIFCTEPFRIPFAGRLDVCCFDKTGTLTSEDLVVEGVAGTDHNDPSKLVDATEVPLATLNVLASAHALVRLDDGEIVGDPMEKNTLTSLKWKLEQSDTVVPDTDSSSSKKSGPSRKIKIKRRFQFSSALKRSSTISVVEDKKLASVKGAPETIQKMLIDVPPFYEDVYKSYTRSGSRVLALAYKYLPSNLTTHDINHIPREEVESKLTFAGFLIFSCPLKPDAIETIRMLNESSHRAVMITGDNPLTAVHVAREVEIVTREVLILDAPEEDEAHKSELIFKSVDEKTVIPIDPSDDIKPEIFDKYDICLTGYALSKFIGREHLKKLVRHTWVYARVSPNQKELILNTIKELGYYTLMCGDGTNDVGALKQAHVGVALLNGTEDSLKKINENARNQKMMEMYDKQVQMMKRWNAKAVPPVPKLIAHLYPPGPSNPHYRKAVEERGIVLSNEDIRKIEEASKVQGATNSQQEAAIENASSFADKMMASLEDDGEPPSLKLGDASVAAPFTSKLANVKAVTHIIRQGRSTLVATIQMYKILALNCLISAYSLSVLYLAGIKISDSQATISGILLSVCFLSVSRAKTVEKLSEERPQPNIFNKYIIGSVLGQFAIHIASLIFISNEVYKLEPRASNVDLEGDFTPNLLNTAVYLLQLSQNVSTFAVNYQGRPFRESLRENKAMFYGLLAVGGLALSGATEFSLELNEQLELVRMTPAFQFLLTSAIVGDFMLCYGVELVLKHLFSDYKPKDIAIHDKPTLKYKKNV
ncbi:hypothetical protein CANCADRAFT_148529 [Tortispora caseinolytica NRRL Y-17796]|uniref:Cation-transporting ATPase n=1 Tax=Tortispora caseinolytica NRRL Y-17796 TaxID=767744 RepID=A0A1E4TCD0_9ASCO|nr:hypothetical protein CANCADRAFT_148529 [Tortispora caseinolytica NRRL Y-17796]